MTNTFKTHISKKGWESWWAKEAKEAKEMGGGEERPSPLPPTICEAQSSPQEEEEDITSRTDTTSSEVLGSPERPASHSVG